MGGLSQFIADVDRVLTRAHGLYPTSTRPAGGVFAAGGGGASVPATPAGGSALSSGASGAAGDYGRVRAMVVGVDGEAAGGAGEAEAVGQQGAAGSGSVRDVARAQADAIGRVAHTGPGMRLMVSTMDERLGAMQRQLEETTAQNRVLALRFRQVAAAYQGLGGGGGGGGGMGALSGLSGLPGALGGAGGGGGFGGLGGLGRLPMSMLARMGRPGGGAGGGSGAVARPAGLAMGAAGVGKGALSTSEVSFEGKGVWPSGQAAMSQALDEALDREGITDPRARAHWKPGMMTIADHESGFGSGAVNLVDTNAHGARQADGAPSGSSRGPWQLVPGTFASHHQPGTSNHIWDPVANACASMNYVMSRYGVSRDGHNLRALVGQANPGVHHGY